jgi:hypothetical protein
MSTKTYPIQPQYIFRIDEFVVNPDVVPQLDRNGKWIPRSAPGCYLPGRGGGTGIWWLCDGTNIRQLVGWVPHPSQVPYKTFSTIYSGGHGFHVIKGDATNPPQAESWHHLNFEWYSNNYSSALTNAGDQRVLQLQSVDAQWPRMLLPDIYHGQKYSGSGYGGLTGDLPIFLALIAFSMRPERLQTELPRLMRGGEWGTHSRSHGRMFAVSRTVMLIIIN